MNEDVNKSMVSEKEAETENTSFTLSQPQSSASPVVIEKQPNVSASQDTLDTSTEDEDLVEMKEMAQSQLQKPVTTRSPVVDQEPVKTSFKVVETKDKMASLEKEQADIKSEEEETAEPDVQLARHPNPDPERNHR